MKFFFAYLGHKKRSFAVIFAVYLLFFASFYLYRLPWQAIAYPSLLSLAVGLIFLFVDYWKALRTHQDLIRLRDVRAELLEQFPAPTALMDADYQEIIRLLRKEQKTILAESDKKYREMIDYYTTWAHQIKTPIASMRLNLQNEDSTLSRQLQNDLNRVEQYADMVMTFLRLDTASTDYVIKSCDLDTILHAAVRKFAGEFIARHLRLDYSDLQICVLTDEKWLSFVIEQVLSNALKYTPSGCISITMEAPKTLCIRDSGIGIAADDLPRIFENGYTGANGRSYRKASGIGLYLCRRICTNLGHTISAESEIGKGTVIRIDLDAKTLDIE